MYSTQPSLNSISTVPLYIADTITNNFSHNPKNRPNLKTAAYLDFRFRHIISKISNKLILTY